MIKSRRFIRIPFLLLATIVLSAGCGVKVKVGEKAVIEQSAHEPEELEAVNLKMRYFLHELDADRDTWDLLSESLKASMMKIAWSSTLLGLKGISGELIERQSGQAVFTDKLPDAPAGRYFICDFDSRFSRGNVTERVVLVLENEDWKIAGYFRTKTLFSKDEEK